MPDKDKKIAESMVEASRTLPDDKKEFLLGFAEGVAAMADRRKQSQPGAARDTA